MELPAEMRACPAGASAQICVGASALFYITMATNATRLISKLELLGKGLASAAEQRSQRQTCAG